MANLQSALDQLQLATASVRMNSDDFAADETQHQQALLGAIDGVSSFFLHTDLEGVHHDAPIYLDQGQFVMGHVPGIVGLFVAYLARETKRIDKMLKGDYEMPLTEIGVWETWKLRLELYRVIVDEEVTRARPADLPMGAKWNAQTAPSERIFEFVTSPLVQGLYPQDMPGIANWNVAQKPDFTTLPSLTWVFAVWNKNVNSLDTWIAEIDTSITKWRTTSGDFLRGMFNAAAGAASGVAKTVLKVIGLGLLGLGVYKLGIEPMMARERERRLESESDDDD